MLETRGNLWEADADALCITTNSAIRMDGNAVMGGGCAKEAADRFPELPKVLASKILERGNIVQPLVRDEHGRIILSFPTKPDSQPFNGDDSLLVPNMRGKYTEGSYIQSWMFITTPEILLSSSRQLVTLTDYWEWNSVVIPRPGCGLGGLTWPVVKEIIEPLFDDRFSVITF